MSKHQYTREAVQSIHDQQIGYIGAGKYCNKKLIERRKQHERLDQLLDYVTELSLQQLQKRQASEQH